MLTCRAEGATYSLKVFSLYAISGSLSIPAAGKSFPLRAGPRPPHRPRRTASDPGRLGEKRHIFPTTGGNLSTGELSLHRGNVCVWDGKFRFFAKRPKFLEHDFHFCWKRKKQKTLRTKRQDFLENLCRCAKILTFNDRPKAAASGQTYDLRSGKKWIT